MWFLGDKFVFLEYIDLFFVLKDGISFILIISLFVFFMLVFYCYVFWNIFNFDMVNKCKGYDVVENFSKERYIVMMGGW